MRPVVVVVALFVATALAEIAGCYLPYLWLREGKSAWLLVPAAGALALFVWLLTLHPMAAARTYAAYGGVYVSVAVLMSLFVERRTPQVWELVGTALSLLGMSLIAFGPRSG